MGFWANVPHLTGGNKLYNLCTNYHGVLTNGPVWVNSPVGQVLSFDGSDDYVDCDPSSSTTLTPSNDYTVISYFSLNAIGANQDVNTLFSQGSNYSLYFTAGGGKPNIYTFQPGVFLVGTNTPVAANTWNVFAATRLGSAATVYANGVACGTATHTGAIFTGAKHWIGRRVDNLSTPTINGKIACVMLWHRALSAQEIADVTRSIQNNYDGLLNVASFGMGSVPTNYVETPSGGVVVGGTVSPVKSSVITPSGGVVVGSGSLCSNFDHEPIAVDQPSSGSGRTYPFYRPSDDIAGLFADAYIAYEDNLGEYTLPFRVSWIYGFGTSSNSPIGGRPTPTHTYDLIIEDAADQVVFDSTESTTFETRDWDSRLRVVEWTSKQVVCRVVYHTCWDPDDSENPGDYLQNLEPESALLHADTINRIHAKLRKIYVETDNAGLVEVSGKALVLRCGYNIDIAAEDLATAEGELESTALTISAVPGAGAGRNPGCSGTDREVQLINLQAPDASGNFVIETGDCHKLEPSIASVSSNQYALNRGELVLTNDCDPRCQCWQFENVHNAIVRLDANYSYLGLNAGCTRDVYVENRTRWIEAGVSRLANPLRLAIMSGPLCQIEIAGGWCNNTGDCLDDLELRFTITYSGTGEGVCGKSFRAGNSAPIPSAAGCVSSETQERYTLAGSWPTYSIFFDTVAKGAMAYGRFRLELFECDTETISVTLGAYVGGVEITYNSGWPDSDATTPVDPISVETTLFSADPCSE